MGRRHGARRHLGWNRAQYLERGRLGHSAQHVGERGGPHPLEPRSAQLDLVAAPHGQVQIPPRHSFRAEAEEAKAPEDGRGPDLHGHHRQTPLRGAHLDITHAQQASAG